MWIMYEEGDMNKIERVAVADNPAISATSPSVVKNNGNVGEMTEHFWVDRMLGWPKNSYIVFRVFSIPNITYNVIMLMDGFGNHIGREKCWLKLVTDKQ